MITRPRISLMARASRDAQIVEPVPITSPTPMRRTETLVLLLVGLACLVVSRIGAREPGTWVLEVFPIFIAVPILVATARRFPLTPLAYRLIFVHALILMLGGHYTYAQVPLGFWMERAFHLARNDYDRIGHFAQGFVPAMLAREILLRRSPLERGRWLAFLVVCVCMTVSVTYEFIEWGAAVAGGSSADAFLGTQGDVWGHAVGHVHGADRRCDVTRAPLARAGSRVVTTDTEVMMDGVDPGVSQRSSFVTVLAWVFIAISGYLTLMAILQNVMLVQFLPRTGMGALLRPNDPAVAHM